MCVEYVIGDRLIYSGLGWHSVDFVRLLGKDSSGLYALKVGEEHVHDEHVMKHDIETLIAFMSRFPLSGAETNGQGIMNSNAILKCHNRV